MIKDDNIKKGNKVKIDTVIKGLEKRGMKGYYAEDGEEALKMILDMMPDTSGASIPVLSSISFLQSIDRVWIRLLI